MERLFKNGCGRWQFGRVELSCGSVVEVEAFGHWLFGRIEAGERGYFLLDPDTTAILYLRQGMKARLPEGVRPRGGMI